MDRSLLLNANSNANLLVSTKWADLTSGNKPLAVVSSKAEGSSSEISLVYSTGTQVGIYVMFYEMMNSNDAIQKVDSEGFMQLAVVLLQQSQAAANAQIQYLQNTDIQNITNEINSGDDETTKSTKVNELTSQYNLDNTIYNKTSTLYNGINSGLSQTSSDMTQTIQINLKNTDSVIQVLQTVVQAL